MSKKDDKDKLVEHIQSELEDSLHNIDAATQSKITQARHRALEQKPGDSQINSLLPAGVVATACVLVLMFSLFPQMKEEESAPLDEFELISNIDELEILEELEFYEWLDEYELPT
mgnify:CR=1 FL=1|jgi:hypothetical protein